ncbi:hypothetical protein P3T42_005238 [Paraburkholderia sp. GAS38]|jgi:HNH endonuclease|uniref:HNH endonuclease n=1 Tax=Paraburkholderia sp. GAS38 TaxID=3035133 RepID=UPI003D1B2E49
MSDIAEPVELTPELTDLVAAKAGDPTFTHQDWGCAELEPYRSFVRRYYRAAQNGRCVFCRNDLSLQAAENCQVEHIAPKSRHPQFMFEPKNLCVICADCNTIKRNQEVTATEPDTVIHREGRRAYPATSNGFLIVHPHFDEYDEHILIIRGLYFDRTEKGHFTIGACRLNRRLRAFGWDEQIIDNGALMNAAQRLLDANNRLDQLAALQRVREACLP